MRFGVSYICLALLAVGNLSSGLVRNPNPGDSALCEDIKKGDIEAVRKDIASGADVNAICESERTPLSIAVSTGKIDLVRFLMDEGASVNGKDRDGHTALMSVSGGDSKDLIALLVERGADVNAQNHLGSSALMLSASNHNGEEVEELLIRGAQPDLLDKNGSTAMMYACWWEQYHIGFDRESRSAQVVASLVRHGAKIDVQDNKGMTALMYSAGWHHPGLVKQLLKLGAGVSIKDKLGRTALTWAARDGQDARSVSTLIASGASTDLVDLILLKDEVKALRAVRDKSSNLKGVGPYGESCLMAAAENNMPVVLEALLARKADANAYDEKQYTPLMLAVGGRPRNVSSNIGSGRKEGSDPQRARMVKLLLQSRPDAVTQLRGSSSALMIAREVKDQGIIDILTAAGVKE